MDPLPVTVSEHLDAREAGCFNFVHDAIAEMTRRGMSEGLSAEELMGCSAICARYEGRLVGVLLFGDTERKAKAGLWVWFGFVDWKCRQQGVYRRLWAALVEIAKRDGRLLISGATHVDNSEMQLCAESLGRRKAAVLYEYDVE
ncbi:hypothetical protein Acid345_3186 [Candidatus Koribacter versatilis Ellin345]|uniref:N-acetyltransferase domain-containing protein n=1 Tax=Koribacter versatilis (strain Ellin345) TaxID=204669 RepID=Q1ILR3_KORVE|nr:GNAT family N-acetyltransferase [Candidatus Koribacter versatilis]ABF42187.1 hypothetical protein Acid345_3186 [Candidatus Koribacter versatilis Ellin345]